MGKETKACDTFRRHLKDELGTWKEEGLVSTEQAQTLSERYRLDDMVKERGRALMLAIYILGAAMIGGGVVSFVAAHWEFVPKPLKIALIIAVMLICQVAGFCLWQVSDKRRGVGHALVLVGTLIFGANIGLIAQVFHIHSHWENGVAAWAVGAAVMALAVWSVPIAVTATILSLIWFCAASERHSYTMLYSIAVLAVFLPVAFRKQSRWAYLSAVLAAGIGLVTSSAQNCVYGQGEQWWVLAWASVASLLCAWGFLARRTRFDLFGPPSVALGYLAAGIVSYLIAFRETANELSAQTKWCLDALWPWQVPLVIIAVLSLIFWILCIRPREDKAALPLRTYSVAVLVMVVAATVIGRDWLTVVIGNVAICLFAVGLIHNGFLTLSRQSYWAGILTIALVIASRFLEYETGLLLKSAIFTGCGIGLIVSGTWFEGYLRKRRLCHE
ncbi:MAG: DUF2157 domain-containing protein [Phycisphaerae bacterium]|jgi:uncharacterized membrane protein